MEIKDFKERKLKLENDIMVEINKLLNEFEKETGYTPNQINAYMQKECIIGGFRDIDRYLLTKVKTEIDI